jgi:ABC-type amino acid transport substrate-binding protein
MTGDDMQWFAAALLACGCVNLAEFADFPPAVDYIAKTSCSVSAEPARCRGTRAGWEVTYARAVGGKVDDQRTVALCLSTGCDTAIVEEHVLGCAWRHVIAGKNQADADRAAVEAACGGDALDAADRQTARDQASVWLQLLAVTQ